MEFSNIIASDIFIENNELVRLELSRNYLSKRSQHTNKVVIYDIKDIIWIDIYHTEDKRCCYFDKFYFIDSDNQNLNLRSDNNDELHFHNCMILIHAEKKKKAKWKYKNSIFFYPNPITTHKWIMVIQSLLKEFTGRPKSMLILINPSSGKKKGKKIFKTKIKSLLERTSIKYESVITKSENHMNEIISSADLCKYDSLIFVGGDGTISEGVNAALNCQYKDKQNNQKIQKLRIGIIPCGSTDTISYSLHGHNDVTTSLIHIILGNTVPLDVCSIYNDDKMIRYFLSIMSYGYLGDIMRDSQNLRFLGSLRYDLAGFRRILMNNSYAASIKFKQCRISPVNSPKCIDKCKFCDEDVFEYEDYKTISGNFMMVSAVNITCECNQCPKGMSPNCHKADGNIDIIVIRSTGYYNILKLLLTLGRSRNEIYDLPFVEVYRTNDFSFQAPLSGKNSTWNCDGDVISNSSIQIKTHRKLIEIFSPNKINTNNEQRLSDKLLNS